MRWALLALLVGCGRADLEGIWDGDLDCGAGASYATTFDLHVRGSASQFRGDGVTTWSCQDASGKLLPCDFTYVVDVKVKDDKEGKLDMTLTDCVAVVEGQE